jgi:hypothetical protein
MKGKRLERVERRRQLVEQNLIAEGRPRPTISRKGCLGLFGSSLLVVSGLVALGLGLH